MQVLRNALRGLPLRPFASASVEHAIEAAVRVFAVVAILDIFVLAFDIFSLAFSIIGLSVVDGAVIGLVAGVVWAIATPADITTAMVAEVMNVESFIGLSLQMK